MRDYFIDLKESYAEETEMLLFNVNMASMFTPLSIVEASFRALKIHVYEARESKHTLDWLEAIQTLSLPKYMIYSNLPYYQSIYLPFFVQAAEATGWCMT